MAIAAAKYKPREFVGPGPDKLLAGMTSNIMPMPPGYNYNYMINNIYPHLPTVWLAVHSN